MPIEDRIGHKGSGYQNSIYIFNAIKKYGSENFVYEILATTNNQEVADELEKQYIEQFDSKNHDIGYNIKEGGSAGKHSEETKQKIAQSIREKEWSEEALAGRAKGGKSWKGKKRGPKTDEQKAQTSEFMKMRHQRDGHPMQGKHHTEETRKLIGEASKGRKNSEEHKQKLISSRLMSKEREEAIIKAYLEGMPYKEIETIFNTSSSCIARVAKRNNLPKRPHRGYKH